MMWKENNQKLSIHDNRYKSTEKNTKDKHNTNNWALKKKRKEDKKQIKRKKKTPPEKKNKKNTTTTKIKTRTQTKPGWRTFVLPKDK